MKRNEYGMILDHNGYAPSIVQTDMSCCFCCRKTNDKLDRHEIFGGRANREKSKRLGLWVLLCHSSCHEGAYGVHQNADAALRLHRTGQEAAMTAYGWGTEDFIRKFGKNYL